MKVNCAGFLVLKLIVQVLCVKANCAGFFCVKANCAGFFCAKANCAGFLC